MSRLSLRSKTVFLAISLVVSVTTGCGEPSHRPLVAIEVESKENTLDGCTACGCRVKGELEPAGHTTSTKSPPGALPVIVTDVAVVIVVGGFSTGAGGGISPVRTGGVLGVSSSSPETDVSTSPKPTTSTRNTPTDGLRSDPLGG